jgi:hypothetical protein
LAFRKRIKGAQRIAAGRHSRTATGQRNPFDWLNFSTAPSHRMTSYIAASTQTLPPRAKILGLSQIP